MSFGVSTDLEPGTRESGRSTGDVTAQSIAPLRIPAVGATPIRDECEIVVEAPLTITIEGVRSHTLMCTPAEIEALAVGFAASEAIISCRDDLESLSSTEEPLAVRIRLAKPSGFLSFGDDLIKGSSAGYLGRPSVDQVIAGELPVPDSLRATSALPVAMARKLFESQDLFKRTGGSHAAGIYTADGEMLAFCEDIGRHNAFDKAIGRCLLDGRSPKGGGVMLSGRVSLELVVKAARAGIELITAVSAPTLLAVTAADRCNITLCGFVRDTRATIYTHPRRITDFEA